MKAWYDDNESQQQRLPPPEKARLPSSPTKTTCLKTPLEVYNNVVWAIRLLGGTTFHLIQQDDDEPTTHRVVPHMTSTTDLRSNFLYYASKVYSVFHLCFFVVRFVNMTTRETALRGVLLLGIACYILGLVMVQGIWIVFHLKRHQLIQFLNRLNGLDSAIFGNDTSLRTSFINRHTRVYNRAKYYMPGMIIFSMILIGLNQANHPTFTAHITSLAMTSPTDEFFSTPQRALLTLVSFLVEFSFVLYFYIALYQFLFLGVTAARSCSWCLEHLVSESTHLANEQISIEFKISHITSSVEKYEHIRSLISDFNSIFSSLMLFWKGILVLQMSIMSYIPLKRVTDFPFTSVMIFVALTVHYAVQLAMMLPEMGHVAKMSGAFRNAWLKGLRNSGIIESAQTSAFDLKLLISTCTPFGFECGGCYVIGPNTILSFFSIVTSYLIVMLQLQI